MGHDLTISALGLKLIKAYEGFRPQVTRLVTGQSVLGYGHSVENDDANMQITREQADILLRKDLKPIMELIDDTVFAPLTQSQFDALCALIFNIGPENFISSNVRKAINNGRVLDAAAGFDEWRKAEIAGNVYVVDALMRRRTAEKALFLRQEKGMLRASRNELDVKSDNSFVAVSDDGDVFDPDIGIVDMAPYAKKANPSRRREDGPMGLLTLSEVAPQGVHSPQTLDDDRPTLAQRLTAMTDEPLGEENAALDIPHPNGSTAVAGDELAIVEDVAKLSDDLEVDLADKALPRPSPIAIAAAEVSERLDALIEDRREPIDTALKEKKSDLDDNSPVKDKAQSAKIMAANSNDNPSQSTPARVEPDAQGSSADRYIERNGKAKAAKDGMAQSGKAGSSSAPGVFMFAGGCLLAGGLMSQMTQTATHGDILGVLVPTAIVVGGVMLIASAYYLLRQIGQKSGA